MDVIEELKSFFGKIQKKKIQGVVVGLGGGGWVRVDVNEELKFLCKCKKKMFFFFWGGGGGVRFGESGWMEELKFL